MYIVMAALAAAAFSWIGNKLMTRVWKAESIIFITPVLEESAKSLAALTLNQPIVLVHGAFGLLEAIYDMATGRKNGPLAALASIAGHLFYGVVTMMGSSKWGIWAGIMMAYGLHALWNGFVMKALARSGRS